jgi:hypothetical protein
LHSELFFGPPFRAAHLARKPLEGAPLHALGLLWKWRQHARIATQPHPDVIGPAQRPLMSVSATIEKAELEKMFRAAISVVL